MIAFDPTWDVETHLHADACDGPICTPMIWRVDVYGGERGMWRCVLSNDQLATWTQACRDVLKLPVTGVYREVAELTLGELEAAVALRKRRVVREGEDYSRADLAGEVAALAGDGKRRGDEWWFCCPIHEERTPSLHVNSSKQVWMCFGCGRSGGVVQWRKEARLKSGMTASSSGSAAARSHSQRSS